MLTSTTNTTDRILLDYDIPYETFKERYLPIIINRARELLGDLFLDYGISKSASGNTHMVIRLRREVTQLEAVIIATLLGSDFKRECYNWFRLFAFGDSDSLFAQFKEVGDKSKKNRCSDGNLRKFAMRTCPGLVIWIYKYATLRNYLGRWVVPWLNR
jgi:hypothetical protein